jgi:hypothetical protein
LTFYGSINCHGHRDTYRQWVLFACLSISSIQTTIQYFSHLIPLGNSPFELVRQGRTPVDRGIPQLPLKPIHLPLEAV